MDETDDTLQELSREHLAALDVLRIAKNVFFWLALVSIVALMGSWYVVRHTHKLDNAFQAITVEPGVAVPSEAARTSAARWLHATESSVALAGFVGRASIVMLVGLSVLGLLVSLSARLGGASGMARAGVWSMMALAMIVPWEGLMPAGGSNLPSVFYDMTDLNAIGASVASTADGHAATTSWLELVRFCLYPLLVAAVLVAAQLAYRRGYRRIVMSPDTRLPIREV